MSCCFLLLDRLRNLYTLFSALRIFCLSARPIILTVAKCWDPSPQGYFTLPRSKRSTASLFVLLIWWVSNSNVTTFPTCADEPIRPIDPAAWVSHSVAMTGAYPPFPGSSSLSTITSSSSVTETERESLVVISCSVRFNATLPPLQPSLNPPLSCSRF